jgi:hypothetical protein
MSEKTWRKKGKAGYQCRPLPTFFSMLIFSGQECPLHSNHYAFLGAIASLAALATRNFTTVFALI